MSRMQGVNRTMKPSLHELITDEIHHYLFMDDINISNPDCEQLAEQIIKIVRDYHLVEGSNHVSGRPQMSGVDK